MSTRPRIHAICETATLPDPASTMDRPCSRNTTTIDENRRLNSRAPVSRLPPEVLSSIFLNVQAGYFSYLIEDEGFCWHRLVDMGSETCVRLTHVCHDWREVALGTPTLWTRVVSTTSKNKWTQELLLRSKTSPLTCIMEGSLVARGRSEMIAQLGRCQTLSMRDLTWRNLEKYWSSKVNAPHLEYLVIDSNEEASTLFVPTPFILSDAQLYAPSLRRLELEGCGVDWKSEFMGGQLTHLGLSGLPDSCKLECNDFIKVLANMPFLEHIHLNCDYVLDDEDTSVIPFPENAPTYPYWHYLRRLDITDDVKNIARFLNNIILLPTSNLHLGTMEVFNEAKVHLPAVFHWVSKHFKQIVEEVGFGLAPQKFIRSFALRERPSKFTIQGFNEVLYPEEQGMEHDALFLFKFLYFNVDQLGEDFRHVFLPFLPISSIVSLDMSTQNFHLSTSCWITVFGSIPTLESVRLSVDLPMCFFYALRPLVRSLPFKALKSIGIFGYMLSFDYQIIAGILRERLEYGVRLVEFVFCDDDFLPSYSSLSIMMEVVSSVGVYQPHESD